MPTPGTHEIGSVLDEEQGDCPLLPEWYMPFAGGVALTGWRRKAALVIVASFLALTAAGLCGTYGYVGLF